MFGTLRPKPDARMLRRVAARLKVRAEPLRPGRGHAGAPEGGALARHAHGLDAALPRRRAFAATCATGANAARSQRGESGVAAVRNRAYVYAKIGVASARCTPSSPMTPSSDPPAGVAGDPRGRGRGHDRCPSQADRPRRRASAPLPRAPARKRPRPGERRVQILETLATHARSSRAPSASPPPRSPPSSTSPKRRSTATSRARRRCSRA